MASHLYRCPLRWADMDVYGIVNNVVFLRLLEEARVDFIFRLGQTEGDAFFKDGSVVVRHEIDYKRQLVHRHVPVDIELWVTDLGTATVTIAGEIKDGDLRYASAATVMAPFDYVKRRPRRLTDEEIAFFEKYLEEPAG
ncbi:acyl-CoA thioesterase [Amycolatopsis cihanbeyliensis]|uniref:Acyl-CoA thioester hydrolase n=1 Tax=Amycolatopsis cihanbeyliensis TaxID=1128664 RepID=A0A542DBJ9_AMYCI|nr:thioesterase family protein [Amycolatopsis cihanbeyliensis]TQJ00449.1 acyl-CoA thioester hydrolase [Amycolatopsis cihanbeyliensis]